MGEDEYKSIKRKMNVNDPLTAFALLACSFGSKWASGYARDVIRNYVKEGKNSSLKYRKGIEGVHFEARSYLDYSPLDMIIYCDPPYQNTIGYNANKEKFNHDLFWATMRQWAKDNTVLISEYNAPYDFKCIKEFDHIQSIRSKNGCLKTKEKIFIYDK
jgi:DNA adenine methylase